MLTLFKDPPSAGFYFSDPLSIGSPALLKLWVILTWCAPTWLSCPNVYTRNCLTRPWPHPFSGIASSCWKYIAGYGARKFFTSWLTLSRPSIFQIVYRARVAYGCLRNYLPSLIPDPTHRQATLVSCRCSAALLWSGLICRPVFCVLAQHKLGRCSFFVWERNVPILRLNKKPILTCLLFLCYQRLPGARHKSCPSTLTMQLRGTQQPIQALLWLKKKVSQKLKSVRKSFYQQPLLLSIN